MNGGNQPTLLTRLYRKFFILPPVSERRMVEGRIREIFYPYLRKEADETYIYYLVMKNSFFVTAFFSILYWVSYVFEIRFDFLLFAVHVEQTGFVRSMIWSYPFAVSTVVLIIFVPYAWLLFRENIDLSSCDLLHHYPITLERTKGDRKKLLKEYRFCSVVIVICMYGAFALPEMILRYYANLADSTIFFLTVLAFYAGIYSGAMSALVICGAGYWQHWRRLGPRYRNENS